MRRLVHSTQAYTRLTFGSQKEGCQVRFLMLCVSTSSHVYCAIDSIACIADVH